MRHTTYCNREWPSLGGADGTSLNQFVARVTGVNALATAISLELTGARRALEAAAQDAGAVPTQLTGIDRLNMGSQGGPSSAPFPSGEFVAADALSSGCGRVDRPCRAGVTRASGTGRRAGLPG